MAGVILVGVFLIISVYSVKQIDQNFRPRAQNFMDNKIGWKEFFAEEKDRCKDTFVQHLVPWLAFLCFISGAIVGSVDLLLT